MNTSEQIPCMMPLKIVINSIRDLVGNDIKFWIAGGAVTSAVTGSKINDYDVFSPTPNSLVALLKEKGATVTYENPHFVNFRIGGKKVQVITRFEHQTMEHSVKEFDFTVVCGAYDGETFVCHDRFWQDIATRRLVINTMPFPLKTMERVAKYAQRGFAPCPVGLLSIAKAIHALEIDWDNPDENQLSFYPDGTPRFMGVD